MRKSIIKLNWNLTSCFPWQYLADRTEHGGHSGKLWQLCRTGWLQECWREHGLQQGGGRVPQGIGGNSTLRPHSQYNSSKPKIHKQKY